MIEGTRSGRPRDRAVGERILRAAVQEIADAGVDAFSMSNCARRARVSKASIYLRWPNAEELITAALASVATWPVVPDLGDLEAELTLLATAIGGGREAWSHIQLLMRFAGEAERHPHLFKAYQEGTVVVGTKRVTEVFARAQARGELPRRADPAILAISFMGALSIAKQLAQTSGHGLPTKGRDIVKSFLALRTPDG
jgi:AcrR family transcriptional regulator